MPSTTGDTTLDPPARQSTRGNIARSPIALSISDVQELRSVPLGRSKIPKGRSGTTSARVNSSFTKAATTAMRPVMIPAMPPS